jgi:hypothetical protein
MRHHAVLEPAKQQIEALAPAYTICVTAFDLSRRMELRSLYGQPHRERESRQSETTRDRWCSQSLASAERAYTFT